MNDAIRQQSSKRIALVTDSSCDLPEELIKEHDIRILPLYVVYPDRQYRDRCDIQAEEVYARMPEEVPSTSMPLAGDVTELLENLKQEGFKEVLGLFISSGLSATHDMFKTIAPQVKQLRVEVVDSLSLSMGLGFQVCEAAELIKKNLNLEEIAQSLKEFRSRNRVFYVIPTLQYLRKGGRIGLVEGTIGDFLNIKPIISVNPQGIYYTYAKVRGRKASLQKLPEIIRETVGEKMVDLAVLHGGAHNEGQEILEKLKQTLPNLRKVFFSQISPVLGVHTGPGLVGVAFNKV